MRLIAMRHAKSAWDTDAPTDHARPLNKRGRRDAPRIAAHLEGMGWAPEVVLSSDSARTRETWARMEDHLDEAEVHFTRRLYHAGAEDVVEVIRSHAPPSDRTVMVLGHNPGWEDFVEQMTGQEVRMTTANAALMECDADSWAKAAHSGAWRLVDLIRPKEI